ncbi:MAG: hypothetical protein KUG74_01060 [Rhodobacteraceae bacterium]|nr:hypothetical protein [Paracoccaceae bacterium]
MSGIIDTLKGVGDSISERARVKSIQELPLQGRYWYYAPEVLDGKGDVSIKAEYGFTYQGLQWALGGSLFLFLFLKSRGR